MKKFFGFSSSYRFEVNDLRAIFTLINIILILAFGASFAWIGLTVAALERGVRTVSPRSGEQ